MIEKKALIQDQTLREMFRTESEEHLRTLDEGLLRLEQSPGNKALLDEIFRAAHSLKGAARMLGLNALQGLAHKIEDDLNRARRGDSELDTPGIAAISKQLPEIRLRVAQALDGDSAPSAPSAMVEPLTQPASHLIQPLQTIQASSGSVPALQLDSIRVEARKLDALVIHASELKVTRARITRRLDEIDQIADLATECRRMGAATDVILSKLQQVSERTERLRTGAQEDSARLDVIASDIESGIRAMRLLPLNTIFRLFSRMVHDLASEQGKEIDFIIEGGECAADKHILEEIKDPLMHILRNAVDHGIETVAERVRVGKPPKGTVRLRAQHAADQITVEVQDDGRGLDEEAIKRAARKNGSASPAALDEMNSNQIKDLIFGAGLTTASFVTDVSGRGIGLDVVRSNVEKMKGNVAVESAPGDGMCISLHLPMRVSAARLLLVEVNGHPYGLPIEKVIASRTLTADMIFSLGGRQTIQHEGHTVSIARLADLLELGLPVGPTELHTMATSTSSTSPCVILQCGKEIYGILVDVMIDEQDVVIKPSDALLAGVRHVVGASILDSGEICMVLNTRELLAALRRRSPEAAAPAQTANPTTPNKTRKTVLLAEDSIVTRTQEARILSNAGYDVVTAVDGLDAWNQLASRRFDAVVSDINMPNLDGLALAEKIRQTPAFAALPVILVTSLASDDDKRRGLDVGANAYITKSAFDQQLLIDCLERLI